jgi:hypothetical protein
MEMAQNRMEWHDLVLALGLFTLRDTATEN